MIERAVQGLGVFFFLCFALSLVSGCATEAYVNQKFKVVADATDEKLRAMEEDISENRSRIEDLTSGGGLKPGGNAAAVFVLSEVVHFGFDKWDLSAEAKKKLDHAAAKAKEIKYCMIALEGHTDSMGSTNYNLSLGNRRAQAVYRYLVDRGVKIFEISDLSFGEEKPLQGNKTPQERSKNRRVKVEIYSLTF